MTRDVALLAKAMVRYEKAHEAVDRARSAGSARELAAARIALLEQLAEHGYEPEPEVRAQMHRDLHSLRAGNG